MSQAIAFGELPVGSVGRRANGWWGMLTIIATEAALFAFVLFSYFYIAVQHGRDWLPADLPSFAYSGPDTVLLIASSLVVGFGERTISRGGAQLIAALSFAAAAIMGVVFLFVESLEWTSTSFSSTTNSYGSLYYLIEGLHVAHLVVGVLVLLVVAAWTALGYFDARRSAPVSIAAVYWYFVNAVWIAVFFTLYVTPRLNVG